MNTTRTDPSATPLTGVADDLARRIGEECPTCTGLVCLDCANGTAHDRCTRPCPECAGDDVDWDLSWETSRIITELRGLERTDDAIRGM